MVRPNEPIADKLLFAIEELIRERYQSDSKNTPEELTKLFWEALAPFANEYLIGTIDLFARSDGTLTVRFVPKK